MNLRIAFGRNALRVADLVPLTQQLSDAMISRARQWAADDGQCVPCGRGCAACCRYLVPVSSPEATHLWETMAALPPAGRDAALTRLVSAAKAILGSADSTLIRPLGPSSRVDGEGHAGAVSRWYAGLNLPCPLLVDGACSLYAHRPLACREHLVTTPADHCGRPDASVQPLRLPVSLCECLEEVSTQLDGPAAPALMLPLAVIRAVEGPAALLHPAEEVVDTLLAIFHRASVRTAA